MYFAKNGLSRYSFSMREPRVSKIFRNGAPLAWHEMPSGDDRRTELPGWLPVGLLMMILAGFLAGAVVWPAQAHADTIFVKDPITESGITSDEAQAAKALIRSAVANRAGDQLVSNESTSKIQLQPRLLRLGDVFLLTLEKAVGGEIVYVSQTKFPRITELDMAARRTVSNVLAEPLASYKKSGAPRYPSAPFSDASIGADSQANHQQVKNKNVDRPAEDTATASANPSAWKNPNGPPINSPSSNGAIGSAGSDSKSPNSNVESNAAGNQASSGNDGSRDSQGNTGNSVKQVQALGQEPDPSQTPGQNQGQNQGQSSNDDQMHNGQNANGSTKRAPKPADPADVTRSSHQLRDIVNEFPERQTNRWLVGLGPMISRHMASDQVMYGLSGAYVWDMNPFLSTKASIEANLTGGGDGGQYYNAAIGGNYYFVSRIENAPYVTADIGYGYASSLADGFAEGFSLGLGAGYELLRTSTNPLDLSLRFSTIFSGMSKGYGDPSIIGARVSVSI